MDTALVGLLDIALDIALVDEAPVGLVGKLWTVVGLLTPVGLWTPVGLVDTLVVGNTDATLAGVVEAKSVTLFAEGVLASLHDRAGSPTEWTCEIRVLISLNPSPPEALSSEG